MTHWSGRTSSASFGSLDAASDREEEPDFVRIQRSDEFLKLRSGLRRFVFPVSVLFLVWYFAFVVLAAYAGEFMSRRVAGTINVGLLLGVLQFVSTVVIALWYRRFARRRIDPQVAALRGRALAEGES
ncbi:MAG: DUF485 domain-containing protein [Kibdelosporangium sp.]